MLTRTAEVAHSAATVDREQAADRVLCAAVEVARDLIAEGRVGKALFVLNRAGMSAERILGRDGGAS